MNFDWSITGHLEGRILSCHPVMSPLATFHLTLLSDVICLLLTLFIKLNLEHVNNENYKGFSEDSKMQAERFIRLYSIISLPKSTILEEINRYTIKL